MPPLRVIQCGTGTAGKEALRALIESPAYALAGLFTHSEANAGRDAGSFAGLDPTGIRATTSLDAAAALEADAVCYMLLAPDLDHICRFLASGKNVVTTAGMIHPAWNAPGARRRLAEACGTGGTSFYATGINPGFVDEILPLVMSMLNRDWTSIRIREYADCARYPAPHIINVMGFGHTPEAIAAGALPDMSVMTAFFEQSVAALGHGLGLSLDAVEQTRSFALAREDYDIPAGRIAKGTVAGQRWSWTGMAGGLARILQETFWITRYDLGPGWPSESELPHDVRWEVTIEGTPSVRCTLELRPSFERAGAAGPNPSAVATAMAAVNSLIPVAAARPGILASADLPLPRWRGSGV